MRNIESFNEINGRFKKWGTVIFIIITVHSTAAFTLFICEEAMQTTMFGAFAYNNADDFYGLKNHIKVMEANHKFATFATYTIGLAAPLVFPAYVNYLKSNEAYIVSQKALVNAELNGGNRK